MVREIITIHIGQCGSQIGKEYWKLLSQQHNLTSSGLFDTSKKNPNFKDRKEIFFYESDDGRFIPRSLFIDTEPRVINDLKSSPYGSIYNPENLFVFPTGQGAGNNWASGYSLAQNSAEEVLEMVDREAENSDSLAGFNIVHSIGGGTGSGFGSYLIEQLHEKYKGKFIASYSVLPSLSGASDVVVHPYNSVLTLKRLIQNCDINFLYDNDSLNKIASEKLRILKPNFSVANAFIARTMSTVSSPLRFPGYTETNFESTVLSLVPSPKCHFGYCAYTPLAKLNNENIAKTSVGDVLRRLLLPSSSMLSVGLKRGVYHSLVAFVEGEVDPNEIQKSMQRLKERKRLNFVEWVPASFRVCIVNKSPYEESNKNNKVSGLMMANHSGIAEILKKIRKDFNTLKNKNAFVGQYLKEDIGESVEDEMEESREVLTDLIEEYEATESKGYLDIE